MKKLLLLLLVVASSKLVHAQLENPTAFIGERINGVVSGTPLYADNNGQLRSGPVTTFVGTVSGTNAVSTTSTTYVTIPNLTITPDAGTYNARCQITFSQNTSNANVFMAVYAGGNFIQSSQIIATPQIQAGIGTALNAFVPGVSFAEAAVNGSQAIECRWQTSTGTVGGSTRVLQIERVR